MSSNSDDLPDTSESPSFKIPPEPKLPYRLHYPDLEHHATALGYVCMTYSTLEFNLGQIIEALLSCNAAARRAIVDATGASIQSRCQLILKFASINSPSIKWFETMDYWLSNVIVKEISPRRNRLVHDVWLSGAGMARQWDLRVSLSKSQSRREKTLSDPKLSKIELESTWLFVRDIKEAAVVIFTIHLDYVVWKSTGQLPELHERFHPQNMRRVAKPRSLQEP